MENEKVGPTMRHGIIIFLDSHLYEISILILLDRDLGIF